MLTNEKENQYYLCLVWEAPFVNVDSSEETLAPPSSVITPSRKSATKICRFRFFLLCLRGDGAKQLKSRRKNTAMDAKKLKFAGVDGFGVSIGWWYGRSGVKALSLLPFPGWVLRIKVWSREKRTKI